MAISLPPRYSKRRHHVPRVCNKRRVSGSTRQLATRVFPVHTSVSQEVPGPSGMPLTSAVGPDKQQGLTDAPQVTKQQTLHPAKPRCGASAPGTLPPMTAPLSSPGLPPPRRCEAGPGRRSGGIRLGRPSPEHGFFPGGCEPGCKLKAGEVAALTRRYFIQRELLITPTIPRPAHAAITRETHTAGAQVPNVCQQRPEACEGWSQESVPREVA